MERYERDMSSFHFNLRSKVDMGTEKVSENGDLYLEKEMLSPYDHVSQISGKKMRMKIVKALNHWLKVPDGDLENILDVIHMTHVASLLIDDIQDGAKLRRGLPAAHNVYGVPLTLNASYHALFLAVDKAYNINPKISKLLVDCFLGGLRGQGMDLYWRENFICPTNEEYMKMVELKTGYMFSGSYYMMQLYSDNKTDYSKIISIIGRYFQIRDDYCNLRYQEGLEEWPGKDDVQAIRDHDFCEDITEGKFSFPVIHALSTSADFTIFNILKQRTRDVPIKKYCVSLMEKVGSLQYTREVLEKMDLEAREEVSRLGGNPEMTAVLDELHTWKNN